MFEMILHVVEETIQITFLVGLMMILVDVINTWTKGKIKNFLEGKSKIRQYFLANLIGIIPGCFGGMTVVTLYMHGFISFGALTGSMIAVAGDEAYVMLALFPEKALLLFAILFTLGILIGILIDRVFRKFNLGANINCENLIVHEKEKSVKHFFLEHIWEHIIKEHIWKIAIWTFVALLFVELSNEYLDLEKITSNYKIAFLFIGALVGLIPESGPHLIFVKLFSSGMVPFSVLLTNSIVQDGHSLLPLLSYSVKDTIKIKLIKLIFALILGSILFSLGF
ncbi:MAG: arsenic efflux protein [Ignavibacteria bacterium]|nr:arsenic efflux protein [Ignavibacteria bacterium]